MKLTIKIENGLASAESTLEIEHGTTDRQDASDWLEHLLDACMVYNETTEE